MWMQGVLELMAQDGAGGKGLGAHMRVGKAESGFVKSCRVKGGDLVQHGCRVCLN